MRPDRRVGQHRRGPDVSDWPAGSKTLSLLRGKWHVAVLAALADGPRRHMAVRRFIGNRISGKVLTETLQRMEQLGLVSRTVLDDGEPGVAYALTPLGYALLDPVASLIRWAQTDHTGLR
jgi:DNA-binding HxlR family transcriptional regulator